MNLALLNEDVKMSSYDFLNDVVNPAREAAGESKLRHNWFLEKIEDEIGAENLCYRKSVAQNKSNSMARSQKIEIVDLNIKQMLLVGMRESKAVRLSVLNKLEEMQNTINKQAEVISQMVSIDELKEARMIVGYLQAQNAHLSQRIVAEQRITEIVLSDKKLDKKIDDLACEARQCWSSRSDEMELRFKYETQCFALKEKTDALTGLIENQLGIDLKLLLKSK